MSVANVIQSTSAVIGGSDKSLTGPEVARLAFLTRAWSKKSVTLQGETVAQTKKNINKWLNDFEQMFRTGQANINVLSGFGGFAVAREEASLAGLIDPDNLFDKQLFLDTYSRRISILNNRDFTQARFLRNSLAVKWKKDFGKFYDQLDSFNREASALGLGLNERVDTFLGSKVGREFVFMRDSAGRNWKPEAYANMYSRTRAREAEDEIHTEELIDLGADVIKISNANTITPLCKQFENKYFSLTGKTPGLPLLRMRPPFHPNCRHRILADTRISVRGAQDINKDANGEIRSFNSGLTASQKKTIKKQEAFNLQNRRKIVA